MAAVANTAVQARDGVFEPTTRPPSAVAPAASSSIATSTAAHAAGQPARRLGRVAIRGWTTNAASRAASLLAGVAAVSRELIQRASAVALLCPRAGEAAQRSPERKQQERAGRDQAKIHARERKPAVRLQGREVNPDVRLHPRPMTVRVALEQ